MHVMTAARILVGLCIPLAFAGRALAGPPSNPNSEGPASLAVGAGAADRVVSGSGGVAFPLELTLTPAPVFFVSAGAVFSGYWFRDVNGKIGG